MDGSDTEDMPKTAAWPINPACYTINIAINWQPASDELRIGAAPIGADACMMMAEYFVGIDIVMRHGDDIGRRHYENF